MSERASRFVGGEEAAAGPVSARRTRRGSLDRKTQLLQAATRAVEHLGVRNLRVEDVASEAGVSPALVHYYFGSRDALIEEMFRFSNERTDQETDRRSRVAASPARIATERTLLLELESTPGVRQNWIVWAEMMASAPFNPSVAEALNKANDDWLSEVTALVRDGQADGSITTTALPEDAAERLTCVVDGIASSWMLGSMDRERAERLIRDAIAIELDRPAPD